MFDSVIKKLERAASIVGRIDIDAFYFTRRGRSSSCRSNGCRPPKIAATMSGDGSVSRSTQEVRQK
jgi:hypothetical protein